MTEKWRQLWDQASGYTRIVDEQWRNLETRPNDHERVRVYHSRVAEQGIGREIDQK